jgi:hypothetical protein
MKNYEEMIIELALSTNDAMDYLDKAKVRRHNKAMTKLYAIADELKADESNASRVYSGLLTHPEEKVRLTAASHLIQLNLCTEEARKTMHDLSTNSNDAFIRFEAGMFPKYW